MTDKQHKYIRDIINSRPDFKKELEYHGIHQDENGVRHYYQVTDQPYPNDKDFIGQEDEVQAAWVNSKQLFPSIKSVTDLTNEQVTRLITNLKSHAVS